MQPFLISDDLVLVENAIYLPKEKTLVISDLQLGQEQQMRAAGSNIIYEQAAQMLGLLEMLIAQNGAKRLVINGDLKHEFGRISGQERRDIVLLLSRLKKRVEIVVVKGNHDLLTKPIIDELGVPLVDSWSAGGFYAIHGHRLPDTKDKEFKKAHTVIIGHAHPAITINDGVRKERYKCILVGKFKGKRLVALPSFSTIVEGTDILQGENASHSPLLQADSSMVYVLADEIRSFGKVSDIRRILG